MIITEVAGGGEGRRGRDRMVVGITTTCAIGACHHWCWEFESRPGRDIKHHVINVVSDLRQVGGFLRVLRFPPPIKLTAMKELKYCWSEVDHQPTNNRGGSAWTSGDGSMTSGHNSKPLDIYIRHVTFLTLVSYPSCTRQRLKISFHDFDIWF
jgi:hypothetical protein